MMSSSLITGCPYAKREHPSAESTHSDFIEFLWPISRTGLLCTYILRHFDEVQFLREVIPVDSHKGVVMTFLVC